MRRLHAWAAVLCLAFACGAHAQEAVPLRAVQVSFDRARLVAGAEAFARYCLGCHSLKYLRYSRVGRDLGLTEAQVKARLMLPANARYYATMTNTLRPADAARWLGVAPPDLTLEARYRGADWIYTYLTGFYLDPTSAVGWNNHAFPHAAMPNVLAPLGGIRDAQGKLIAAGTMDPSQFDGVVRDLTSWLVYTSDPSRPQRHRLGLWVLPFLLGITGLTYLLKRSYWRTV